MAYSLPLITGKQRDVRFCCLICQKVFHQYGLAIFTESESFNVHYMNMLNHKISKNGGNMLNIVFMGTPDFAKESLKQVYEKGYNNKARIKMYIRSIEVASL